MSAPVKDPVSCMTRELQEAIRVAAIRWSKSLKHATQDQKDMFAVNIVSVIFEGITRLRIEPVHEGIEHDADNNIITVALATDRTPQGILAMALERSGIKPAWNQLPLNTTCTLNSSGAVIYINNEGYWSQPFRQLLAARQDTGVPSPPAL